MNRGRDRRWFLKISGVTTLGLGIFPGPVWPSDKMVRMVQNSKHNHQGLTILFQGDSITDGKRGRSLDPNHIMGHGYAFSVASRWGADYPERNLNFYNRGVSGDKVIDLHQRWQEDALDLKPDALSILVGINDTAAYLASTDRAFSPAAYKATYRKILDESLAQNEKLILVLGLPFVVPVGPPKENWEKWDEDVRERQEIVKDLAEVYGALLVDYPMAFERAMERAPAEYWIWDGIHPTVAGHEVMAREWMSVVARKVF